jgi:hypothetical protein
LSATNLVGQRFGRWSVLQKASGGYVCRCDCGVERLVPGDRLQRGGSLSCGCYARENAARLGTKHGHYAGGKPSPELRSWLKMKSRCYDPHNNRFDRYGCRGIRVCDRWLHSFENFLADMGPRPSPKHSIDRIDNDKDYCPENCKWSTAREQARNRSTCRYLEHGGKRMLLTDWARELGVTKALLNTRLRRGWSVARTLSTPLLNPFT